MRTMNRVDATISFEFSGHLEGHDLNWGHHFGFYFLDQLKYTCVYLYTAVNMLRPGHALAQI